MTYLIDKAKGFAIKFGLTILEIVDLVKDLFYVITINHQNQVVTILLWIFALFVFSFNIIDVAVMTKSQYQDRYGDDDIKELEDKEWKNTWFFLYKLKRAMKVNFLL